MLSLSTAVMFSNFFVKSKVSMTSILYKKTYLLSELKRSQTDLSYKNPLSLI